MGLEIGVLGSFAVRRDGNVVSTAAYGGQLAQRLVRMLAVRRGEVATRDMLIDALWGEQMPADPAANLNVLANRARRGLGDPDLVETTAGGYRLSSSADVTVDTEQFAELVDVARTELGRGRPGRALAAISEAMALWRGEPLPEDAYADWAQPHRERLQQLYQNALEIGAQAALGAGDPARAADFAAAAVAREPLRESAHLLRIRALTSGGDIAAALAAFETLRSRLVEELGIDPSRTALDLHRQLLEGEVAVEPDLGPRRRDRRQSTPMVGRRQELARLSELDAGQHVALISGQSGSGKSRLLEELAVSTDQRILAARAVLPERNIPWVLARSLLESATDAGADPVAALSARARAALADLLPGEKIEGTGVQLDAESRRALVLEGASRVIAAVRRPLVVVDDLQWADPSSLDLLAIAASRSPSVMMVLAYRPEEVTDGSEVESFLRDLQAETRPLLISLGALPAEAVEQVVPDRELAALVTQRTDGTPFAVFEVLRNLEEQGSVRFTGGQWHRARADALEQARAEAHAGQRRSVVVRANRQPRSRREILELLALLGRPASTGLLASATGADPSELAEQLGALARADLVRPCDTGWQTAHDLVGETLAEQLAPVDRRRAHERLARALEADASSGGERARHLAGAGDPPAAAAAYAGAARQQSLRSADREAGQLAEAGLQLDPPDPVKADLLEVRGQTRFRAGSLAEARHDLRDALTLTSDSESRVRILAQLASMASGSVDLLHAENLAALALAEAGDDPAGRARALTISAVVDMNLERAARAEARYAEALALFEQVGDSQGMADVIDGRAMATFMGGDIIGGADAFDLAARLFADAGNLLRVVTPRSTRGHALMFAGEAVRGIADSNEALDLALSLGNPEGKAYALWQRSEILVAAGQITEGRGAAEEALAIAERMGHRGWSATSLNALGLARYADGDFEGSQDALAKAVARSENLAMFSSIAHARWALALVAAGRFKDAADHVGLALATGPPLGHYEGRLAQCAVAVALGADDAQALLEDACRRAEAGGHGMSLAVLEKLRVDAAGS